jgi:uncharacterized ion transporter superfamily protein YfcC
LPLNLYYSAGEYERITNQAGQTVVNPNVFNYIANTPVNPIKMISLIFTGFSKQSTFIFTMFFIGAAIQMIIDTGAIHAVVGMITSKFRNRSSVTIIIMMVVFGVLGVPIQNNISSFRFAPSVLFLPSAWGTTGSWEPQSSLPRPPWASPPA